MIEAVNLTKRYFNITAVENISLHVKPGEVYGLLGPNGAGKTTTLKMLAGILSPTEGSVRLSGFDIKHEMTKAKQISSYLPDKPFVYEKLTGNEFLEFVTTIYNLSGSDESKRLKDELLDTFSLKERLNELVEGYSHGMRQKLLIVSAIITLPKVIIIDEPMVGLDTKGMRQVESIFKELAMKGTALIVSTHTMSIAERLCHRVGIIDKGRLLIEGNITELREKAESDKIDLESIFLKLTNQEEQKDTSYTSEFLNRASP